MKRKPNIVYILADDLGYGDLSCYGANRIETPNADSLARDGVLFSDAHSPSAVCTPTRYSILTGEYNWRSSLKEGVLGGHSDPLIGMEQLTVPSYLRKYKYTTACIGKWHLGLGWDKNDEGVVDYSKPISQGPINLGFDYFYGIAGSLDMPPYCFIENNHTVGIPSVEKKPKDFSQQNRKGLMTPGWKDEEVNQTLTDKATTFIKNHVISRNKDPFFLYFPVTGPHTPWAPNADFENKSKIGRRGDMILELDWTIGQIKSTLTKYGIWEDTLLILTSDNGPHPDPMEIKNFNHQPAGIFRGQKSDIWEGGHRVPFIATWPNFIKGGLITDELICLTDLLGTCVDILQDSSNEYITDDTLSMLPAMKGNYSKRNSVVHHSLYGMFSIRKGNWKLVQGRGGGGFVPSQLDSDKIGIPYQGLYEPDTSPGQLYNIYEDKEELNNLYLDRPDIVENLTRELIEIINC